MPTLTLELPVGVKKQERNVNLGRCFSLDLEPFWVLWGKGKYCWEALTHWREETSGWESSLGGSGLTEATYAITRHPENEIPFSKVCPLIGETKNNFSLQSVTRDKGEGFPGWHSLQWPWELSELSVRMCEFEKQKQRNVNASQKTKIVQNVPFYLFFCFILFLFYFLTLQYCIGFAIYQNESTTGIHVFPILNPLLPLPSPYHAIPLGRPSAPAPSTQNVPF